MKEYINFAIIYMLGADLMDSKLFKSAGIAIGVFVVIIFLLFGIASCSGGGSTIYTYETLQEEMLEIAKEYYGPILNIYKNK